MNCSEQFFKEKEYNVISFETHNEPNEVPKYRVKIKLEMDEVVIQKVFLNENNLKIVLEGQGRKKINLKEFEKMSEQKKQKEIEYEKLAKDMVEFWERIEKEFSPEIILISYNSLHNMSKNQLKKQLIEKGYLHMSISGSLFIKQIDFTYDGVSYFKEINNSTVKKFNQLVEKIQKITTEITQKHKMMKLGQNVGNGDLRLSYFSIDNKIGVKVFMDKIILSLKSKEYAFNVTDSEKIIKEKMTIMINKIIDKINLKAIYRPPSHQLKVFCHDVNIIDDGVINVIHEKLLSKYDWKEIETKSFQYNYKKRSDEVFEFFILEVYKIFEFLNHYLILNMENNEVEIYDKIQKQQIKMELKKRLLEREEKKIEKELSDF